MTALINGATGFIGRRLIQPGDRALVRHPSGLPNEVLGDLADSSSLARACVGVETVCHRAGLAEAWRAVDEAAMRAVLRAPTFWNRPAWALRAAGRLPPRLAESVDRLMGTACYSLARSSGNWVGGRWWD